MLGEGAFGIVYLCEQHAPIQREVAIKLLRPGAGDRGTLSRFDAERRFLARLHHPAIAQIFDTGLLPDGRPWFIMEHVRGVPITEYCDRAELAIEARLRLFVRLCQGVQHAHDQGVVHRDLKPANVLVVEIDGEAQPKIIDFGVARALERSPTDGGAHTETGRVVGTPGYMSPEQMAGDLASIDARSDVFSLGVVLYELLTGELPWGRRPTSTDSEPPRPSSRITTHDRRGTAVARQRGSQPKRLAARLRGDLDWIVLKALAREPARRYATAAELAADVLRHLGSETVLAGPPSFGYRLHKFTRRHRVGVATVLGFGVLLGAGLWVLGDYRAAAQDRSSDAQEAVASLLARANDPSLRNNTNYVAMRKAMSVEAVALYDRFLSKSPEESSSRHGRMRALTTLSVLHESLAEFRAAERDAREAVAEGERLVAAVPDDVNYRRSLALAAHYLGRVLRFQGRGSEARAICQRSVDLYEHLVTDEPSTTDALVVALESLAGTYHQARDGGPRHALLERAADLQAAVVKLHPERLELREELVNVAILRATDEASRGEFASARALLAPARAWLEDGQGLSRGTVIKVYETIAQIAAATGELQEAGALAERGLTLSRAWLQSEPEAEQPFSLADNLLELRCRVHAGDATLEERLQPLREWISASQSDLARFPEKTRAVPGLLFAIRQLAEDLLTTGCREDLADVDASLRAACKLLDRLQPGAVADPRYAALLSRGALGLLANALALADADAIWDAVVATLDEFGDAPSADPEVTERRVMYGIGAAASRQASGRAEEAQSLLDRSRSLLDGLAAADVQTHAPLILRLQALLALRRGDVAFAKTQVDELMAGEASWYCLTRAADAAYATWRALRRAEADDAPAWRDRAIEICQRAVDACHAAPDQDAWVILPALQCRLRMALARDDLGADGARAALDEVLTALAGWRDRAHADQWDEALYRDGLALLER
ncbi:MAG TPA: serine/threonine-protein kinase [Planctomycetota bacterium]|nr:serine/threonine-protein kinase [Planctomycetota bacterium]